MKKLFLFCAVLTSSLFVSCVKERDCECTTTESYAGVSVASSSTTVYKDVTKKQAKTLCVSSTSTDETGVVTTNDCKLK
jgi:hypothetical protein